MNNAQVITAIVIAVTLVLMLIRPRGLGEAFFAASGAAVLLAANVISMRSSLDAIRETAPVLWFLAGMMIVTGIVERAGVIEVIADRIARICGTSTRGLFIAMFWLSALITATMSLDITIIMMTPILYALTRRHGVDPVPFLFACAFVANIGSLILPVSNLTNLLLVNRLDLAFGDFVRVMWFPNLIALLTTLLMFLWLFRDQLSQEPVQRVGNAETIPGIASPGWRTATGAILLLIIVGLLIAGFTDMPIWITAVTGAAVMLVGAVLNRRITAQHIVHDLSLSLFVFVISMTILVQATEAQFLESHMFATPGSMPMQIITGVMFATAASNVINNVPAIVVIGEILGGVPGESQRVLAYASLIGANIGPALTTYGSLATMLWLSILRKRGTHVGTGTYLRVSFVTVPVVLLTTSLTLWLSL